MISTREYYRVGGRGRTLEDCAIYSSIARALQSRLIYWFILGTVSVSVGLSSVPLQLSFKFLNTPVNYTLVAPHVNDPASLAHSTAYIVVVAMSSSRASMASSTTNTTSTKPTNTTTSQHDINILLNRTSVALARSQRLVDSWLPSYAANDTSSASSLPDTIASNNDSASGLAALLSEVGRSERAGLGFVDPDATSNGFGVSRSVGGESELEKLRRQMLGKRGAKQAQAHTAARGGKGGATLGAGGQVGRIEMAAAKSNGEAGRQGREKRKEADSEDEDEGRSGAFKSKKQKVKMVAEVPKKEQMTAGGGGEKVEDVPELNTTAFEADKKDENGLNTTEVTVKPASTNTKVEGDDSGSDRESKAEKKPTSFLDEILLKRDKKKKKKKRNKSGGGAPTGDIGIPIHNAIPLMAT
jgi:hypothetical protein